MVCNLVGVDRQLLVELQAMPDRVLDVILPDDGQYLGPHVDLDKTWHGLHYLLTGDPWEGSEPLCWAILGGKPIGKDSGYGPPRYLLPKDVAQVSAALDDVSPADLVARYDGRAMDEMEIYPHGWAGDDGTGWLLERFDALAAFYSEATARDMAVLLSLN